MLYICSQKNVLHVLQNTQISYQSTDLCVARCFFCLLHCLLQKRWIRCWALDLCVARNVLHFLASGFSDADNIHHPSISLYVVSRTIQNPSFNTPYDLTTRIKSLICKITRFYMKIFVTRSYGTLKRYIHDFLYCYKWLHSL